MRRFLPEFESKGKVKVRTAIQPLAAPAAIPMEKLFDFCRQVLTGTAIVAYSVQQKEKSRQECWT